MPVGVSSGLPAGWEWDYDGTRWFYTFKANGHVQYHFPSEGDEFPDFVGAAEPAPNLEPEERLESHQQVKRATGTAPPVAGRRKKQKENVMTATARPVGIEWDGDVGDGSSEEEEGGDGTGPGPGHVVFEPENLMFLGPQAYTDVSPLNDEEEEAAKRTVVGVVRPDGVSPAETNSAGTPAVKRAEPATATEETRKASEDGETGHVVAAELIQAEVALMPSVKQNNEGSTATVEESTVEHESKPSEQSTTSPVLQEPTPPPDQHDQAPVIQAAAAPPQMHHGPVVSAPPPPSSQGPTHTTAAEPSLVPPRYELPAPNSPFNPVGIIAEMPTEDTPRSHIELNPIPVEIMDSSVLAPIETAPPFGVAELPGQSSSTAAASAAPAARQVLQQRPQQGGASFPPAMRMKIKRKPTSPNAAIPSPVSAGSSSFTVLSPSAVSPPSVSAPSPVISAPSAPTPPPPAAPQYRAYAPVSPLLRADTEPVGVVSAAADQHLQQQTQSTTAPSSPVANPRLDYAPTVLRPAGRKLTNVSPERKQHGASQLPAEELGLNGTVKISPQIATAAGVSPDARPPQGQALLPGRIPPQTGVPVQTQMLQGEQAPSQAALPQQSQPHQLAKMTPQGQIAPLGHSGPREQLAQQGRVPLQEQVALPGQAPPSTMQPPMQHGPPVSLGLGQYPPVPIPQPYGQYQRQSLHISQQPGHPWLTPGQQPLSQMGTMPQQQQQQQQPAPAWMRQSMPPGYPQLPPNGRHSMMAQTTSSPIPFGDQYQVSPSSTSPPNQPSINQGRHQAFAAESKVASPLRPRAESQPSGLPLPTSSLLKTPQSSPAVQPTVLPPVQELPKPGNVKVGTGSNCGGPAAGPCFPPSRDHPIGLVGDIANQFAAEMQALLGSSSVPSSGAAPSTNAGTVNPEPESINRELSPSHGRGIGRIEEHESASAPASAKEGSMLCSGPAKPAQPSPQPDSTQTQHPPPLQQVSLQPSPSPPRVSVPINRQPGALPVLSQGARAGAASAGQATPPKFVMPHGSAPPQQWLGNMQQPMQRPPSVPPQIHMQPSRSKENKWTKWFKSSKSEKKPEAHLGEMSQQQHPSQGWGQPQQWQPGPPMAGHPMQRPQIQGQPIQGFEPGGPIQGHRESDASADDSTSSCGITSSTAIPAIPNRPTYAY
ncbi:hypothetical protein V2A60_000767 [Cordyceps javanica]